MQSGMKNNRLVQLKEMLKADPGDPFLHYAIAQEHLSSGDFQEANTSFAHLAEAHPDYVATYYHYGMSLYKSGEENQAVEIWRKGKEVALAAGDRKTAAEIAEILDDFDDEEDW